MTTLLSDTFDRANSTTTVGAPQIGPSPTVLTGTWGINTNNLYAPTLTNVEAVIAWGLGAANVEVSLVRATNSSTGGPMVCASSATDFYYLETNGSTINLSQRTPGGVVILAQTGGPTFVVGDTWTLSHNAGWLRASVNGNQVIRYKLPAPLTATQHGVRATATNIRFDNIVVTDTPPAVPSGNTGGFRSVDRFPTTRTVGTGFIYRGRDTKALDTTGVA